MQRAECKGQGPNVYNYNSYSNATSVPFLFFENLEISVLELSGVNPSYSGRKYRFVYGLMPTGKSSEFHRVRANYIIIFTDYKNRQSHYNYLQNIR